MASSSGTSMHFELCESLETLHTADVRGLAALEIPADGSGTAAPNAGAESKEEQHMDVDMSNGGVGRVLLATSSRDKTAAVSVRESGGGGFTHLATLAGHTDYVVPICLFSAPERGPGAGYFKPGVAHAITGSRDTSVKVFEVSTGTETDSLGGHEYQVTGIAITRDGDIVSASLDNTLRLWRNGSCISVLKGHSGPVLCVCALENGDIVSGSGDSTLKKWIVSKTGCICESTWTGHTDTVRCLCALPGIGIVSGSHDTTLRMWTDTGSKIAEFIGHTALVYSVSANATRDLLVSGSEDNTVRVWNLSVRECTQIIDHPGCVWAVCILPGGSDFATGCADGVARVFTSDASRAGSADVVGDFTARNIKYRESAGTGTAPSSAGAHAAASNSGLPANLKLEDVSVLSVPGKRDGDIKCVNEMGVGVAYSWSATTGNWEKIGEITGGPGEVSHGNAKTYNGKQYDYLFDVDIGDGVPQRKLPFNVGENPHIVAQKWLEEQNLPETYREQVVDFIVQNTGGSASAAHMDPYQNVDPFTGSGAYQPLSSSGAAAKGASTQSNGAAMKHIPKRGMVYYDTLPFDNLRKKLLEFSEQINTTPMAAAHVECLDHILAALKDVAHYHSSSFRDQDYAFLGTLFQWPGDKIFPCIDIVRMVIFLDDGAQYFASRGTHLLETILSAANAPDASNPTKLVTLKLLCNCFKHKVLLEWLVAKLEMILNALSPLSTSDNKHIRLALANLLVNMSVHLAAPGHVGNPVTFQCCSLAAELLRHAPSDDEEVLFRSLVTIGTSVYASADMKGLIGTLDVKAVIERLSKSSTGKVGEAATSVLTVSK